jgi:tetratricopeptide (TPR) repeat protein
LPTRRRLNRAQRRLIRVTSIAVALGASTWAVYAFMESAPSRAANRYRQGMLLLGPGDYPGAIAQFTRAVQILPEYADAYLGRGKAHQGAGRNAAALADFEKAIAIDPTSELAYTLRGMLEQSQGETEKALVDFTRSIHLRPTYDAYYQRGRTYQTLDQPKRALADYNAAVTYDPSVPYIYRARATAERELGDLTGARKDEETARNLEKK